MESLEEIRQELWFRGNAMVSKFRLDERDWKELMAALEAGGWVIAPKEPTPLMVGYADTKLMDLPVEQRITQGKSRLDTLRFAYQQMIEARPK